MLRLSILLLAAFAAVAQDPAVFRGGVSLVHVDAEVLAAGRFAAGLTKDDFRVFDEGKEQTVVQFSAEEQPLDLILLFDVSGSMRPLVAKVAAAAHQGLQELRPGDRVAVMVFNSRTRMLQPFTEDLDTVERAIREDLMNLRFGGGTLIQAAVDNAAQRLMRQPKSERRRAVLIVTDNMGIRTKSEEAVVRDFWEADALLSGLIIRDATMHTRQTVGMILAPQMLLLRAGMKGIAEKTGGDAIFAEDGGPAFQEMMHRIRSRYSLYYALPQGTPGKSRVVKVELSHEAAKRYPHATIRARHGYMMPRQ